MATCWMPGWTEPTTHRMEVTLRVADGERDRVLKIRARCTTRNEAAVTAPSIVATESLHSEREVVPRKVLRMHRHPPVRINQHNSEQDRRATWIAW